MVVDVLFNKGEACLFTYKVPPSLEEKTQRFKRVYVELGDQKVLGMVYQIRETAEPMRPLPSREIACARQSERRSIEVKEAPEPVQPLPYKMPAPGEPSPKHALKEILRVVDREPILDEEQLEIAQFISEHYISSLGQAVFKMIPSGKQENLLPSEPEDSMIEAMPLSEDQQKTIHAIEAKEESIERSPATHLIFGITGSGKTRIYLELINKNLENRVGTILLLPEIALTYQFLEILKPYYNEQMVMLHSGLPKSERLMGYRRLQRGEALLAVGTRSAIFAPVKNIGLVIIDEEHDASYKENQSPHYHARTVAWFRLKEAAVRNKTPNRLILGSATPSAESYERASRRSIDIHYLRKRATSLPLPRIHLVSHNIFAAGRSIFSNQLLAKMDEHLKKKKQVLLLLNRRGYSNFVFCENCKKNIHCGQCSVTLKHHQPNLKKNTREEAPAYLKCHLCGYEAEFQKNCADCGKPLSLMGKGVQKVEDALERHFPKMEYARLDQDNARQKDYVLDVLKALRNNEIQILVGTQMIAKGFDLPNVTLVGIINADVGLNLPDFRAIERVAQLLVQASGRAGRHAAGEVIMQTMQDNSPVMRDMAGYRYEHFLKQELLLRKHSGFPPYYRFLRVLLKSKELDLLRSFSSRLENFIHFNSHQKSLFDEKKEEQKQIKVASIFGPMPASIEKINNEYRYQILLKDTKTQNLQKSALIIREYLLKSKKTGAIKYDFDMDPIDLL